MTGSIRSKLVTAAAVGAAAVGGAAFANAASTTSSSSSSGSSSSGAPPGAQARPMANFPAHGTAAHEDQEKSVTGANADKAKAAATKAAGGGSAGEVTTDMSGRGYEVTVTKSDGSKTEYHMDSSFNVFQGGHGGPGGPGGPPPGLSG